MDEQSRAASEPRRRKVRKGTHSCWECRRRKIRCQFGPVDDVCLPCQARGSTCRSQEFIDDAKPQPADRKLAQRLGRLEDLMARLVDRIVPEVTAKTRPTGQTPQKSLGPSVQDTANEDAGYDQRLDNLELSLAASNQASATYLTGLVQPESLPTPESSAPSQPAMTPNTTSTVNVESDLEITQRKLKALFPSQSDVTAITGASVAPFYLISLFCCFRDIIEGKTEMADMIGIIPPPDSHPAVLAKRLLQICICIQQVPPGFDFQSLELKSGAQEVMTNMVSAISRLVTSDDDLVSCSEGLECLVLQGFWHANAGNLRKAWLSYRKALGLAQLMGLDRSDRRALKSVDPNLDAHRRPTPDGLWYRITYCDRFSSLLLGIPAGSPDNTFATDEMMKRCTDMEKLERLQATIAGRVIERNAIKTGQGHAMTQAIDLEIQKSAATMDDEWWTEPILDPFEGKQHNLGLMVRLFRQVQHYDLLILLHLPYMLRNPTENRYGYSKSVCVRSSREVLKRFVSFRTLYNSAWSCRHIDYSALVAAMTLLLSYLRQHQDLSQPVPPCEERASDRRLIEVVRERMQHLAVVNKDKLSQESAEIVGQMLPILDLVDSTHMASHLGCSSHVLKCLQLNIPYFGTVNIHPAITAAVHVACEGKDEGGHRDRGAEPSFSPQASLPDMSDIHPLQPAMANLSTDPSPTTHDFQDGFNLDFSTVDPSLLPTDSVVQGMFMQVDPRPQEGVLEFPPMADAHDWTFQGVDTTYWSLLNEGFMVSDG
ncbi:transcription factor sdnS [Echria macrotheca]|uniref:Transcription factor sdnS n=1 Tax=Echria macrotheca TaxID=438768 RepID=A0AAJ0F3U5_9PEZI|nr:transcription factor sdnS [Echria macrotheca]